MIYTVKYKKVLVTKKNVLVIVSLWLTLICLFFITGCTVYGEKLFKKHGCINCHSFNGKGGGIGPDLTNIRERRAEGWIRAQIDNPKLHNPYSQMPSFAHLKDNEKDALIRFITKQY